MDECSAVAGVCDVNANCQDTAGSYICSCNAGFTGDGKTCNGKSVIPRYRSDKQRNYEVPLKLKIAIYYPNQARIPDRLSSSQGKPSQVLFRHGTHFFLPTIKVAT